jgi:hypothetical protein
LTIYFNDFEDRQDLVSCFEIDSATIENCNIVFASYGGGNYEGSAIVLFTKEGKIHEVHGSHCSCNGLEGQWDEEETTWEALHDRYVINENSYFIEDHGADAFVQLKCVIEYEIAEKHLLEG